jgi:hypothetical protein
MDLPYCCKCNYHMTCDKNEVEIDCGHGYVKSGDRYRCVTCGITVITGFGKTYLKYADKEHDIASDGRELYMEEL